MMNRIRNININYLFLSFLIAFIIDRIVNYFIDFPFFVVFGLASIPVLLSQRSYSRQNKKWLLFLFIPFVIITLINNLIYGFHAKNISDLLFIILLFSFYLLYASNKIALNPKWLHVLAITFLVLFSFTLIGINNIGPVFSSSNPDNYVGPPKNPNTEQQTETGKRVKKPSTSQKLKKTFLTENFLNSLANPELDYLEYGRQYHRGLFRVPQVASYFFGFLALFYFYFFWKRNKIWSFGALAIIGLIVFYTGTRIFPITILLISAVWLALKPKRLPVLGVILLILSLLIIFREHIAWYTKDTFAHQYFTFFITAIDNLPRLSRIILWNSWLKEISDFGALDILIGKTYFSSLQANLQNVYIFEWFHNDFMSILYSYGILCLLLYVAFYIKIYRDNSSLIRNNYFIFAIYFSMPLMAFLNGFYYYFPMFILYIFFLIIKTEQSKSIKNENRNIRDTGHSEQLRWV
ncbi:MAG: hypothetical protein K9G76_12955 [Bacteroidales bacterium]|nr:hypothetical protein [Bacteroidales bacterium]MCF8406061.1 hypothetical protein [Bacteroidales bacterium]